MEKIFKWLILVKSVYWFLFLIDFWRFTLYWVCWLIIDWVLVVVFYYSIQLTVEEERRCSLLLIPPWSLSFVVLVLPSGDQCTLINMARRTETSSESVFLSVCRAACLPVLQSACLYICLCMSLDICILVLVCLLVCTCMPVSYSSLYICPNACLSSCLRVCVCLHACLPVCLFNCLPYTCVCPCVSLTACLYSVYLTAFVVPVLLFFCLSRSGSLSACVFDSFDYRKKWFLLLIDCSRAMRRVRWAVRNGRDRQFETSSIRQMSDTVWRMKNWDQN